ncbi:MAG: hypothetical protein ACHQUC_01840 [Chlamydiales bacterium]
MDCPFQSITVHNSHAQHDHLSDLIAPPFYVSLQIEQKMLKMPPVSRGWSSYLIIG